MAPEVLQAKTDARLERISIELETLVAMTQLSVRAMTDAARAFEKFCSSANAIISMMQTEKEEKGEVR